MYQVFNKREYLDKRKQLRQQPVRAEKIMWRELRNKKLGYKFRRQHGIGPYIVDFFCKALNLVIEIDGATHGTEKEIKNDKSRQKYLESMGLTVKRYLNSDIRDNLSDVLEHLAVTCRDLDNTG